MAKAKVSSWAPEMVAYQVAPIDWWQGWQLERDYLCQLIDGWPSTMMRTDWPFADYERFRSKALALAMTIDWEGDISEGIFVSALPNINNTGDLCGVVMGWKQHNNGTSFIVSPHRLPWIDQDFDKRVFT